MKRTIMTALALWLLGLAAQAQGPNGTGTYYRAADGKKGAELKTAFCAIINPHVQRTYKNLWEDFKTTDVRADGKIWDMYSGVTSYTPGTDQNTGSAKQEGDNYNREHSMPKSWFNDEYPMYTDLFHLYPTDSYVNAMRGNNVFGETDAPTYTSRGGFSKLGPARSGLGYSGTVFEPADEYKGDFARTYFYMVTCYETYTSASGARRNVSGWNSGMLAQNNYPALTDWAVRMLLRWSQDDPVSQKELARNEAVYGIQQNRNPFIDYPGLEQYIWGDKTGVAFSYAVGDVTGVEAQSGVASAARPESPAYNMSGQRVLPGHKGVQLRQGRKVISR